MSYRVLVTGAAGFIGSSLAAHFAAGGARVFVDVQRDDAGTTKRWPLSEAGLLQSMAGEVPEVIFHAAGSGTVGKVAAQPALELPANLSALLAVLHYAQAHAPRAHVVLLSSAALYGDAPPVPQREADVRPPVSLYGVAKAQAEQLAAYYAAHQGVRSTAVRLFSVYGPGLRKQLLWDAMHKFAKAGAEPAVFFGTGQERRDWVHIEDVCRFMARLVVAPPASAHEVYNVGGSPATTAEVLGRLAEAVGAPPPRFSGEQRIGDPATLVADTSRARERLGWTPAMGWREGVAGYADWFRQAR